MPKKNNRNTQDFPKYDTMTSEELTQILRLDSEAPEGNGLDIDTLLYITGVLAEREKINNNTGKTAQEAWISFQQNYLSSEDACLTCAEETKPIKSRNPWVRRAIAAAAAVVLMVAVPLTAKAFNWQKIVDTVAKWAKETFSFVGEGQDVNAPSPANEKEYTSLQQALEATDQKSAMLPTWIPDGFMLDRIDIDETPMQRNYVSLYVKGDHHLNICLRSYENNDPEKVEINENIVEVYSVSGVDYYIFSNDEDILSAIWTQGSYECCISGKITVEDIKKMIDSIPKG